MGYTKPQEPRPRKKVERKPFVEKGKKPSCTESEVEAIATEITEQKDQEIVSAPSTSFQPDDEAVQGDHVYLGSEERGHCEACIDKSTVIRSLSKKIAALTKENKKLKMIRQKPVGSRQPFGVHDIKTDKKMNFYTGLPTILIFNAIFSMLRPYLPKLKYWRGQRTADKVKRRFISSPMKQLSHKNEFLMVLMRLRLGLLNEDVADRFGVSSAIASNTFATWIKLLRKLLGHCMVAWLPRETIQEHMPNVFKKAGHSKVRAIIDCSEIFIERPKSLFAQAITWSDYKSHNTVKFLVGISPTGYITFLSDCYGGRASDKFICKDSGFFDLLEPSDEIMADRGFQIREDLFLRHCSLSVPPGARMKAQMTRTECETTKDIANLRIHVERAINRMKTFRILRSNLPITMLQHADDIIFTCAALCNLKRPLINWKTK
ncbi:uncharacterized protein LOC135693229 [Rhopilema esculentum]|uniref:uncharacterized protein LOC135693229 n=1 Tax=Rhopilema esculentum TaxID=499914 RepID=UPI0031D8A945